MNQEQQERICPSCGRAVPEDETTCSSCGHVFVDEAAPPDDAEPFDPFAAGAAAGAAPAADDDAFYHEVEEGPQEEMGDAAAGAFDSEGGVSPEASALPFHKRLSLPMIAALVVANLAVIGAIVYVVVTKWHKAEADKVAAVHAARMGRPIPEGYVFVTRPGTPAREKEIGLARAHLEVGIEGVALDGNKVTVTLRKDSAWDMAERRAKLQSGAVEAMRSLFLDFRDVTTVEVIGMSRFGTGARMESVKALQVTAWRTDFQAAATPAEGKPAPKPAEILERLKASYDQRLLRAD